MNRLRVVRVDTRNGDTHFVMLEQNLLEKHKGTKYLDEMEMRRASKQEAYKPLILIRAE
jgi:hypothetical protein